MGGGEHPSLVSPVESKKIAPTGVGPVRAHLPDVSHPTPRS
jgi:hypothetical protein